MKSRTIQRQLFLIALTPLLLIVILSSTFILLDSIGNIEEELNKKSQDITSQASLMTEFYFYTGNVEKISEAAQLLKKINGLVLIKFTDSSGKALVELSDNFRQEEIKIYSTPVFSKNTPLDDFASNSHSGNAEELLGTIQIGFSIDKITQQQNQVYYRVLMISLISLVIGVILIYLFSRKFSQAMTSLLNAAREVEQGNSDKRCLENGTGELLKFQKHFNHMLQSLQINENDLQDKIAKSTLELNATVKELSRKNEELDKTRKEAIKLERSKAIADERTRIMKDMHDGVGGKLVASLALLEMEQNSSVKNNISNILSECLDDFRIIINSLNVHANTLTALLADFKYRMHRKLESMGITLHWQVDDFADNFDIHPQQSLHILRILQESFTNILKHARASAINFQTIVKDENVLLVIEDNGNFSTSDDSHSGNGIKNMKWRAHELGGELEISTAASGGCRVVLSIALHHLVLPEVVG